MGFCGFGAGWDSDAPDGGTTEPAPEPDDLTFLRRLSLDFRGTMPSRVEIHYFLADQDAAKRGKVLNWMLPEHGQRPVNASCTACHVAAGPPIYA